MFPTRVLNAQKVFVLNVELQTRSFANPFCKSGRELNNKIFQTSQNLVYSSLGYFLFGLCNSTRRLNQCSSNVVFALKIYCGLSKSLSMNVSIPKIMPPKNISHTVTCQNILSHNNQCHNSQCQNIQRDKIANAKIANVT